MAYEVVAMRAHRPGRLLAVCLLSLLASACSSTNSGVGASASATLASVAPTPTIAVSQTPEVRGGLGSLVDLGNATVTVHTAKELATSQVAFAGYRFIALAVTVTAKTKPLDLTSAAFDLRDLTMAHYAPSASGPTPVLTLPQALPAGKSASGNLTFEVPLGGNYTLQFRPNSSGAIADVTVGQIAEIVSTPVPPAPSASGGPGSSGTGSLGASGGTGWNAAAYATAVAYEQSVQATYLGQLPGLLVVLEAADLCGPGMTPEECAAGPAEFAYQLETAKGLFSTHIAFMRLRPAAPCFQDAYAADRTIANLYLTSLAGWNDTGPNTPEGRYFDQALSYDNSQADAFLGAFSSYFSNCH